MNKPGLYEISENLDIIPHMTEDVRASIRGYLEDFGTFGTKAPFTWRTETREVLEQVSRVVGYQVADAEHYEYETTVDYKKVLVAVLWIRTHLSKFIF